MIQINPAAREKIQALVDAEVVRDPALRIEADRGAQSPFGQGYAISLVEREDRAKTEIAINVEGIRVLLNLDTSNLLSGATIDWVEENGESGFRVHDPKAARQAAAKAAPRAGGSHGNAVADRVQQVIDDQINPRIASHGGAVELVDLDDGVLSIRMNGGCQGCAASAATLRMGIEREVREAVPESREIVDVTDHGSGENPYY
jgi:Fe/S biogenesis protein NfuA